jgi:IS30 family transposase
MREGITTALGDLSASLRRPLTWDQGKELALHQQITEQTGTRVSDLRHITPEELRYVAEEVNARPRKSLGWARPAGLIADAIMWATA